MEDRLLKIDEAAKRLGASKDWLYRNHAKLPFTVYLPVRQIRFSSQGIDEWIQQHKNGGSTLVDNHLTIKNGEVDNAGKRVQTG